MDTLRVCEANYVAPEGAVKWQGRAGQGTAGRRKEEKPQTLFGSPSRHHEMEDGTDTTWIWKGHWFALTEVAQWCSNTVVKCETRESYRGLLFGRKRKTEREGL